MGLAEMCRNRIPIPLSVGKPSQVQMGPSRLKLCVDSCEGFEGLSEMGVCLREGAFGLGEKRRAKRQ